MPQLIVIYGPPLSGKTTLAREVAGVLQGKTALVNADAILNDAIRVHDPDVAAELGMVHTQARLLVANYLKNHYNVVLEGAFFYEAAGVMHRHEQEIDQTLALMRNIAASPLVVRLGASEATLQRRAEASSPPRDATASLRIEAAYKARDGSRLLHLNTDGASAAELAKAVLQRLAVA